MDTHLLAWCGVAWNRLFLKTKPPLFVLLQIVTFSMLPSLRMTNALLFIIFVLAYRLALSLSLSFPFLPQLRISVAAAMLLAAPSAIAFTTPVGSLASPVKSLHARYIVSVYSLYPSRFFAISKWKCCNLSIR